MPVGEHEAARLHQEPRAVVLDGVDGPVALRREHGGAVGGGVSLLVLLVAQRAAARVVERVGALDEAHPAAVLLDDLLARRPLALQGGDALARVSELVAQRLHLARRRVRQPPLELLLPRAVVLDALLEGVALRLPTVTLGVHPLLEGPALRLCPAHGLPQRPQLRPEAPVLAPGPSQEQEAQHGRRHHHAAEGAAGLGHRAQDHGLGEARRRSRGGNGQERPARMGEGGGRAVPLEAQARPLHSQLDDVSRPQHRLLHELAGQVGALRRSAVEQDDLALAFEHHRMAGGGGGHHHVRLGVGADGGGKPGQPGRLTRARTRQVHEADALHLSGARPPWRAARCAA